MSTNRVIFLVDGFNLYHSVRDIARYSQGLSVKWLDIHSLCSSYLPLMGKEARLEHVFFFTALATHLNDPDIIQRHETYMRCLEATGVVCERGRFKAKTIQCTLCRGRFIRHEEKETDVAIAAKMCEFIYHNQCDTVVLVTGDTDLSPAVRYINHSHPNKTILFMFPFGRHNRELAQLAPKSFKIHKGSYLQHQFPDPFTLPDGSTVRKPISW